MERYRLAALGALAILIVVSALLSADFSPYKLRPVKTFYVVAYKWGYVFYDSQFNEIPYMAVNRGDEVEIYLIPASQIIRDPILSVRMNAYVEYENRTRWSGIGPLPPNDPRITEEIVASHDLPDHSMFIEGYNVVVITCDECAKSREGETHKVRYSIRQVLEEARASVGYVRFVADKQGSFDVYCTIYCGFGHQYQRVRGAFVVK
ncbi:MAG: hypothetical protein NYU90_07065 [Aigarchaeota archaeon]|nr:hypothetical protein [Candidatus Calditenuis fumarioli]